MAVSGGCFVRATHRKERYVANFDWLEMEQVRFQACGLVKNLALMAHITTEIDEYPLLRLVNNAGVQQIRLVGGEVLNRNENYVVFLNGKQGVCALIELKIIIDIKKLIYVLSLMEFKKHTRKS